jgi:hypothetical protein
MWSRRWVFLAAAGAGLAAAYRKAVRDDAAGDLAAGWDGFLLIWVPAAVIIGLGIAYIAP